MIRIATEKDIERLVEIESQWSEYPGWGKNGFLNEFRKDYSLTFVFEKENTICGFVNIWKMDDIIEINSIVVSPGKTRNGIGSLLINYVIEYAREKKVKKILLEVNEKNLSAISLYKKYGFEVYNVRKKYYNFKDNALLMQKELL